MKANTEQIIGFINNLLDLVKNKEIHLYDNDIIFKWAMIYQSENFIGFKLPTSQQSVGIELDVTIETIGYDIFSLDVHIYNLSHYDGLQQFSVEECLEMVSPKVKEFIIFNLDIFTKHHV